MRSLTNWMMNAPHLYLQVCRLCHSTVNVNTFIPAFYVLCQNILRVDNVARWEDLVEMSVGLYESIRPYWIRGVGWRSLCRGRNRWGETLTNILYQPIIAACELNTCFYQGFLQWRQKSHFAVDDYFYLTAGGQMLSWKLFLLYISTLMWPLMTLMGVYDPWQIGGFLSKLMIRSKCILT